MKTKNNDKSFDCLSNKWHVEELIYEETKEMTDNEIIDYFKKSVEKSSLGPWWQLLKKSNNQLSYNYHK
jgi:hypothetical protein